MMYVVVQATKSVVTPGVFSVTLFQTMMKERLPDLRSRCFNVKRFFNLFLYWFEAFLATNKRQNVRHWYLFNSYINVYMKREQVFKREIHFPTAECQFEEMMYHFILINK